MKNGMQQIWAPRSTTSKKESVQASPTRQSPRRQGKQDITDSEDATELVCARWVIKEMQEADIIC
jgi:hypothetical protein